MKKISKIHLNKILSGMKSILSYHACTELSGAEIKEEKEQDDENQHE